MTRHLVLPKISFRIIVYVLGPLASLIVLLVPSYDIHIGTEYMWQTFAFLSAPALARVISGYFVLGIFVGYAIYDSLLRKYDLGSVEKLCLVLSISYIVSVLAGLALVMAGLNVTPSSFVGVVWLILILSKSLGFLGQAKAVASAKEKQSTLRMDSNTSWLVLISFVLVLFSYASVLYVSLFGGYLSYDVPRYMIRANELLYFGPTVRAPYVWPNVFISITQSVTGLPMLYAYVGLQFFQLLVPLSFYVLLYALFEKRKLAVAGTFLLFFASSTNALALLWTRISASGVFETYLRGDIVSRWDVLSDYYWKKAGTSLAYPIIFSPTTIDYSMTFLAMAFGYKYLSGRNRRRLDLIFTALFTVTALFSHMIFLTLIILLTVMVFSLLANVPKKAAVKVLGLVVALFVLFDFPSKSYFYNYVFLNSYDGNLFRSLSNSTFLIPIIGILSYLSLLIMRDRHSINTHTLTEKNKKRMNTVLERTTIKYSLWVFGIIIVSVGAYYALANPAGISEQKNAWYMIISRNFLIIVPLALGGLPYIVKSFKAPPLMFILSWIISLLLGISISLTSTELIEADFALSYILMLGLPITCLAILSLESIRLQSRFVSIHLRTLGENGWKTLFDMRMQHIVSFLLVFLLGMSFLSFVYTNEFALIDVREQSRLAEPSEIETFEWMNNNIPKGTIVLPLSERSYLTLTSMVSNIHAFPIMWRYSPTWFPYSWLRDVLINSSSPEVILYTLKRLNVSYIYATSDDLKDLSDSSSGGAVFTSLLEGFPIEFDRDFAKLYSVPYPLFNDSNYVLVESSQDYQPTCYIRVFNMLMSSSAKFSIIPDVELTSLEPGYTYLFPSNQYIPNRLRENLVDSVYRGANIVFFDPLFASFNELNDTCSENSPLLNYLGTHRASSTVLFDDNGTSFWEAGYDSGGNLNPANLTAESTEKAEGKDSLKIEISIGGENSWVGPYHVFSPAANWSDTDTLLIYLYGQNTGYNRQPKIMVWTGTSDSSKYEITDDFVGWRKFLIPFSNFTVGLGNGVDWSNVTRMNIEFYYNGTYYLDDVSITSSVPKVIFADGEEISLADGYLNKGLYLEASPELNISAYYVLSDRSKIPYIATKRLGKGSMTLVNINLLPDELINQLTVSKGILLNTMNTLSSFLPNPNSPKIPISLPLPSDLFNYVVPSLASLWHLKGIQDFLLYDYGATLDGEITVRSSHIHLVSSELFAKEISISNSSENTVFQNATIKHVIIAGDGIIDLESSRVKLIETQTGTFVGISMDSYKYSRLRLTKVEGELQVHFNGLCDYLHLSGENLTIIPSTEYTALAKQPTIIVNGSVIGMIQGTVMHENNFFYTPDKDEWSIAGKFTLIPLYSSAIVYVEITNIEEALTFQRT